MNHVPIQSLLLVACLSTLAGFSVPSLAATETDAVKQRADQAFGHLATPSSPNAPPVQPGKSALDGQASVRYNPDTHWIGKGQGDLSKGPIVCQRVSELSARTDLAKQIRVLVKEHMVDRVRDRIGKEPEQDIELTREEVVQEYLQQVTIVERRIDEESKTCHATAVMPRATPTTPPHP